MATFTFLGSGTSTGIPMLGCDCEVCTSSDPRDFRLRSSALVQEGDTNIIIDTTPEFRLQCLQNNVDHLDAVFITHDHADHISGLDDVRSFTIRTKEAMPVYCNARTFEILQKRFHYIFRKENPLGVSLPKIDLQVIEKEITVGSIKVEPLKIFHGTQDILAFKFGRLAYVTDVNKIPEESWHKLQGLEVLILDAVRFKPHPTHYSVEEALEVISKLKPKKAYLTHLNHNIMHERDSRELPSGVEFAYDGLKTAFSL
ncbi:MAG: MBL fold metallo-hydrolase [Planctomycetota bacterium]|jgi:phosphoribosyl 1,2-cyclic phosphate phosphodiesterase